MSFKIDLTNAPTLPDEEIFAEMTNDELGDLFANWNFAADLLIKWQPKPSWQPKPIIVATFDARCNDFTAVNDVYDWLATIGATNNG